MLVRKMLSRLFYTSINIWAGGNAVNHSKYTLHRLRQLCKFELVIINTKHYLIT